MERLDRRTKTGFSSNVLRTWGMVFVAAGLAGRCVIQNQLLNLANTTNQQLLEAMQSSEKVMILATVAIALQAVETCAAPVFCLLLTEGFQKTRNFKKYFLRVLGVALISEIGYNFAFSGKLLDMASRNPVFAMVLCLLVLYFYRRYQGKGLAGFAIKAAVTVAAVLWAGMLRIDSGVPCLILTIVLWACHKKPVYRTFAGCVAAVMCSALSPFYLASPMGFLAVHGYNGDKGADNRIVNYLAYPALLLAVGLAGKFLL